MKRNESLTPDRIDFRMDKTTKGKKIDVYASNNRSAKYTQQKLLSVIEINSFRVKILKHLSVN